MNLIPSVQAMLLCEKTIREETTTKISLINLFTTILTDVLPVINSMGLYARLIDGEGIYRFRFDLVHLPSDDKIASATTPEFPVTDRLLPMELVVQIPGIKFDRAGKYEIQMYADDVFLGHTSVDVVLRGQ
jgi:hypothetical protein